MLSEMHRVAFCDVHAVRDYLFAYERRAEWLPLGTILCPRELLRFDRSTPCELYGLPSAVTPRCPDAVPPGIRDINAKGFFTTEQVGLTCKSAIWRLSDSGLQYPTLQRWQYHEFLNYTPGGRDSREWLASAHHTNFERIVIIPAQEADK